MAHLSQQDAQGLFAAFLLGRFDLGGHDALDGAVRCEVGIDPDFEPAHAVLARHADFEMFRIACCNDVAPRGGKPLDLGGRQDRKSTRLNSSHVKISYAVFCLKKKKQKLSYLHMY